MRRKGKNTCGYTDCHQQIPGDSFLCAEHYESWVNGFIDRCPKCGRFKDINYQFCFYCYTWRPVSPWQPPVLIPTQKQHHKIEYSEAWIDGYRRLDQFFVYILEFPNGAFYVGRTSNLSKEFSKSRKQKTSLPLGEPKLQYVELIATQRATEARENELKRLIHSNPDQLKLMIMDFQEHMREMGVK